MPAYNEASTIAGVLERLYPLVDRLLIVDDGSTDDTREAVFDWLRDKPHAHLISFNRNRGMSAAYYAAFSHLRMLVETEQVAPDDIVLTVDADGQHDPDSLDLLLRPVEAGADAVIAQRDFRLYPRYKRIGNWIMSAWASVWSGRRFRDVESGYRAFRVGPLLDALTYYKGYRYSETVEVAVILPLLGYHIHDTTVVDIPVFRSRTRMKDVVIDLIAMPCAWWRVMATRRLPRGMPRSLAYYGLPLFFAAMVVPLLVMLSSSIYLANDTINNYAHVWYISQSIFHTGTIPLRFAGLDNGRAFTYPYGLVPWTANALVYPLLGDWSVTLFLVLAGVAVAGTAMVVRPQVRDPWLMALLVANPFFIDAIAGGQYAFLWATVAFFGLVWAVERERWLLAAVAMWLTASTHPIEGGLAVASYVVFCLMFRPRSRLPLLAASGAALVALTPFAYFALRTPALGERSSQTVVLSVLQDLPRRGLVLGAPFLLTALAPMLQRHYRAIGTGFLAVAVAIVALSSGFVGSTALAQMPVVERFAGQGSYYGLVHRSTNQYRGYLRSSDFAPGQVYRVLSPNEREQGGYILLQHQAVLANEFFSESQRRGNWSEAGYQCYLAAKRVDRVIVERAYNREFPTNEQALLDALVARGLARVTYRTRRGLTVYDVTTFRRRIPAPSSLKECTTT
ncbi:MAG: glycosyltransferase [Dehalococcoidia bacterium]|nr:glycosyltransferase [Dehalococcoidia bacterium]